MLFCFSSQQAKEEEHVYLVDEANELEVEENEEAHDNLINEDLLGSDGGVASVVKSLESALSTTRRSNHRRTHSFEGPNSGPIKPPSIAVAAAAAGNGTLRSFRKSQASSVGATGAATAAAANGKFVDPSVAVAAAAVADQQLLFAGSQTHQQQSVSTGNGTSISRTFSKLGPFLRRNRSSKGTEHLQREALRKSNETAAGLGLDQSQRYIKLPTSSAVTSGAGTVCSPASSPTTASAKSPSLSSSSRSTPQSGKCSALTKSATSVAIVASGGDSQQKQQLSPSVTSCELSLASGLHSACRSDPTTHRVFHRQRHHSPASSSSSSSSSGSSTSSPPAPTLVPRSANNPPPRPKTSKPSRVSSSNDTIATAVSSTSTTSTNNTTTTTTVCTHSSSSSSSSNSSLPARSSAVAGVLSASASTSLAQLLSGLTAVSETPICSTSDTPCTMTSTTLLTTTTSMLTSSVPSSSSGGSPTCTSTVTTATTTSQCTGSGGSSSGQQSQQQQQQQQQQSQQSQQQQQQSTSASSSSSSSSNHHHHQHQQFINKPPRGWLHPDHKLSDSVGVTYAVRYIGCLGVNTSMKSLDFDTRSLIAKECINRVCEAAGLKTADKKRRTEKRIARMLADAPNMENAGVDVNLSITSAHLNLIVAESGEHLAKHEMPNISFASGGDTDTLDFAAYVAKDNRFGRACFVLECGGGRAQDVITTIGQAFELRFKEFLKRTPRALTDSRLDGNHFNGSSSSSAVPNQTPALRADDREYYNDLPGKIPPDIVSTLPASSLGREGTSPASVPHAAPRKKNGLLDQVNLIDLTDDHQQVAVNGNGQPGVGASASQLKAPLTHDPQYVNCMAPPEDPKDPFDMQPFASALADDVSAATAAISSKGRSPAVGAAASSSVSIAEVEYVANCELDKEDWFHGPISRKQSEELVIRDGDFLVRESQVSSGQYVLTGMQSGSRKHLLLVDPEGVVRTKDKTFESVSHLINYHRNNGLPIISSESALILKHPIVAPRLSTLKAAH